jgi:hypothetical protein
MSCRKEETHLRCAAFATAMQHCFHAFKAQALMQLHTIKARIGRECLHGKNATDRREADLAEAFLKPPNQLPQTQPEPIAALSIHAQRMLCGEDRPH